MRKKMLMFGALAFIGSNASAFATTNLVMNGDFSDPDTGAGYIIGAVTGWTNSSDGGVEVGNSALYGLPALSPGDQNLEVNANTFGTVSQTITLVMGKTYGFSWEYGGRLGGGPQVLDVSIGGVTVKKNSGSYGYWTGNYETFVATSTSEKLQFASERTTGLPSYGNEVDNVSITAVPEPSTWAMMLLGFGGLGFAAYRRTSRNSSAALSVA